MFFRVPPCFEHVKLTRGMNILLNRPSEHRSRGSRVRGPLSQSLCEVTVNISCRKDHQMTTQQRKITTERHKMTTKTQNDNKETQNNYKESTRIYCL